jgi:hypothetical protein
MYYVGILDELIYQCKRSVWRNADRPWGKITEKDNINYTLNHIIILS